MSLDEEVDEDGEKDVDDEEVDSEEEVEEEEEEQAGKLSAFDRDASRVCLVTGLRMSVWVSSGSAGRGPKILGKNSSV